MIPAGNQRWDEGRATYRPPAETIRTSAYDVVEMESDPARAFVERHHYSRCSPVIRWSFGMYHRGELAGVAMFSHPMQESVITNALDVERARDGVELGRFVLLDSVPGNGETWFLARCLDALAGRVRGVVSFSDPVPRRNAAGETTFAGHLGTIYQASNARYTGVTGPSTLRLFPDGRVFSNRAASKIRKRERNWQGAAAQLVAWGAAPLADHEDAAAWLATWRDRLTRPLRHTGNHRYVFTVGRRNRNAHRLPPRPYPKRQPALLLF